MKKAMCEMFPTVGNERFPDCGHPMLVDRATEMYGPASYTCSGNIDTNRTSPERVAVERDREEMLNAIAGVSRRGRKPTLDVVRQVFADKRRRRRETTARQAAVPTLA